MIQFKFLVPSEKTRYPKMSRLFYGSSNVYRFYSRDLFGLDLDLVQCTKKTVFDSHLVELGELAPGSLLVTCVLGNFISDACRGLEAAEVSLFANQQITAHVEALADLVKGRPDVFAFVVPPFRRSTPGMFVFG